MRKLRYKMSAWVWLRYVTPVSFWASFIIVYCNKGSQQYNMQNTGKDGADQRRATVMVIRKQLQLADYVPEGHYSDGRYSD